MMKLKAAFAEHTFLNTSFYYPIIITVNFVLFYQWFPGEEKIWSIFNIIIWRVLLFWNGLFTAPEINLESTLEKSTPASWVFWHGVMDALALMYSSCIKGLNEDINVTTRHIAGSYTLITAMWTFLLHY